MYFRAFPELGLTVFALSHAVFENFLIQEVTNKVNQDRFFYILN